MHKGTSYLLKERKNIIPLKNNKDLLFKTVCMVYPTLHKSCTNKDRFIISILKKTFWWKSELKSIMYQLKSQLIIRKKLYLISPIDGNRFFELIYIQIPSKNILCIHCQDSRENVGEIRNLLIGHPVYYVYGFLPLFVSEPRSIPCPRYQTAAANFLFWIW